MHKIILKKYVDWMYVPTKKLLDRFLWKFQSVLRDIKRVYWVASLIHVRKYSAISNPAQEIVHIDRMSSQREAYTGGDLLVNHEVCVLKKRYTCRELYFIFVNFFMGNTELSLVIDNKSILNIINVKVSLSVTFVFPTLLKTTLILTFQGTK